MSREYKLFVLDVIEFCEKVIRYTTGKQEHEFFADEMALDAVMRNLELIGEASKNIPETVRSQIPNGYDPRGARDYAATEAFC